MRTVATLVTFNCAVRAFFHIPYSLFAPKGSNSSAPFTEVPFYMYEDPEFQAVAEACRGEEYNRVWFGGEWEFVRAAYDHPWRRSDPNEALLFVVPAFVSPMIREICGERGANATARLFDGMADALEQSFFFRRYGGRDHIMVATDYKVHSIVKYSQRFALLMRRFIVGHYGAFMKGGGARWGCTVVVPFHPTVLHLQPERVHSVLSAPDPYAQWTARPNNLIFQGATHPSKPLFVYRTTAVRQLAGQFSPSILISTSNRGRYPPCSSELLEGCFEDQNYGRYVDREFSAKFGLHFRGDDVGSSRFYDHLAAGLVVLVFPPQSAMVKVLLPFQCRVPWNDILYFVDEDKFLADPVNSVSDALGLLDEVKVRRSMALWRQHAADVLWGMDGSRVASNVLLEGVRKCLSPWLGGRRGECPFGDESYFY